MLSHAFMRAMKEERQPTYIELIVRMKQILMEREHGQRPQISSCHPLGKSRLKRAS
jgi:hypothetical protein